jgi:hypothetical protein
MTEPRMHIPASIFQVKETKKIEEQLLKNKTLQTGRTVIKPCEDSQTGTQINSNHTQIQPLNHV